MLPTQLTQDPARGFSRGSGTRVSEAQLVPLLPMGKACLGSPGLGTEAPGPQTGAAQALPVGFTERGMPPTRWDTWMPQTAAGTRVSARDPVAGLGPRGWIHTRRFAITSGFLHKPSTVCSHEGNPTGDRS